MRRRRTPKPHALSLHSFSSAQGFGWARTVNEGYVTEAREDPLCSQDKVDAGASTRAPSLPPAVAR